MTREEHQRVVARYRATRGKATPAEYMAYMWSRQALGEALNAGQRGFLAAAQKPHWHRDAVKVEVAAEPAPAMPPARPVLEADDVPAWVMEGA